MRKKSKFGPKLHEFKRIRDILEFILEISKIIFRKLLIGGVLINGNGWKKIKKSVIGAPLQLEMGEYPLLQHSQVNDRTRPCKKSQTANRISSTHEYLWNSFLRQTNMWEVDYNSFYGTYNLR